MKRLFLQQKYNMKEIIKIAIGITLAFIAIMVFMVAIGLITRLVTS